MLAEEAQEIFALDEVHLAGIDGLRRELVRFAGNGGAEPEHFAGFGDFQDQRFSVGGTDGELHPPFAENEDSAGRLAFDKQHGALGISTGIFDGFE